MSTENLKVSVWFPKYIKCLFIFSQTYLSTFQMPDPDGFYADKEKLKVSMKCFTQTLVNLVPDTYLKDKMLSFIFMNNYVKEILFNEQSLSSFFDVYDDIYKVINKTSSVNYNNTAFLDYCLESEETMFLWVYLLQSYIYILQNRYGNYIKLPTLNDCKKLYSIDHLSKDDWGNVTWFILHTSAMYGKGEGDEIFYNYKALLSCLQFLLPCPKCRSHLRDNLAKIDIDYCKSSQLKLFECSWRLHNVVNESLGKYQPTLKEAIAMYSNLNA
jgi:hypothetical protein